MPDSKTAVQLTVSDLARGSAMPVSTVRYYLREGIVPAGQRLSRTRVLYTEDHLQALISAKELRAAGLSIAEIRSRLGDLENASTASPSADTRRAEILECATACFLDRGFAGASLAAIARSASVSKATLLQYFSSKEEIFMACAERVFHRLYEEDWPAIRGASGAVERLRARWDAYVVSFAEWAPMMDLVRGLAVGNKTFDREYSRLLASIVAPLARELAMLGVEQGGHLDADFLAYAMMGMAEAGARAVNEGRHDSESAWQYMQNVLDSLPDVDVDRDLLP